MKEKILSVTLKDCDVQTKRGSGAGGQNRNKRDTAVRIVHRASGAIGESQEQRSQRQNKETAFRRMVESPKFQLWVKRFQGEDTLAIAELNRLEMILGRGNIRTEIRRGGQWVNQAW